MRIRRLQKKVNKWPIFSLMERHVIGSYNFVSSFRTHDEKGKIENKKFLTDATDEVSDILGSAKLKELFREHANLASTITRLTLLNDPLLPKYREEAEKNAKDIARELHRIKPKYSVNQWNKQLQEHLGLLDKINEIVSPNDTLYILYNSLKQINGLSKMIVF